MKQGGSEACEEKYNISIVPYKIPKMKLWHILRTHTHTRTHHPVRF